MTRPAPLAVDKTVAIDINGSRQKIRLCAARTGLPPLLVVQAGPALPLLQDVGKFQRRLNLEDRFSVAYWEQRGCGDAPLADARSVSLPQQVTDLTTVLQWLARESGQRVVMLGISIGATIALLAAEREPDRVNAVIAVSVDSDTAASDAAVAAFLEEQAADATRPWIARRVATAGRPPYVDPGPFQRRARLLADLDTIERGKTFNALMREMLVALLRTYGVAGAIRALRNMNTIQRNVLREFAAVDLFPRPPRITVPVHFVFGEQDALVPESLVKAFPAAIGAPASTVIRVPNAGHMVHFDQPNVIRSIAERV